MRKDFEPISEPPWRPSVDRFVAIRDPRRAQFSGKLFVVWILLGMAIATGVESTRAAEPAPDEPFQQEYRDGFVRGTTAAENDVRGLTIDRDGRVWAATAAGVRVVRAGGTHRPVNGYLGPINSAAATLQRWLHRQVARTGAIDDLRATFVTVLLKATAAADLGEQCRAVRQEDPHLFAWEDLFGVQQDNAAA